MRIGARVRYRRRPRLDDLAALRGLDPALAAELMVSGRAPWAVLAAAVQAESGRPRASLEYADDPFGVLYLVATWLLA